jgi:Protein of unknown function (DUF3040)
VLSDRERKALLDIEIEFLLADPSLATALAQHRVRGPGRRTRCAHDLVVVIAASAATFCLALSETGGTEGGVTAAVFAVITWGVRVWRFPTG